MFREKRLGKVHQIGNDLVVRVRPKRCKFKTVTCLSFLSFLRVGVLDMVESRRIGIILCKRAV